jgi:hypothetical protein
MAKCGVLRWLVPSSAGGTGSFGHADHVPIKYVAFLGKITIPSSMTVGSSCCSHRLSLMICRQRSGWSKSVELELRRYDATVGIICTLPAVAPEIALCSSRDLLAPLLHESCSESRLTDKLFVVHLAVQRGFVFGGYLSRGWVPVTGSK